MFILASVLNLFSSYLMASVANSFLVIYVAFFAFIIINIEVLSLFCQIKDINILIFSFINLVFSILLFKITNSAFLKPKFDFQKLKNVFLLKKYFIFLSVAFLIFISASLFLSYIMPPLEPDSQTYHFLRAVEFVKNQSLNHFDINDIRALIMPINSEIVYSWLFSLKKNFHGYGILSFISFISFCGAIFSIMKHFKFPLRKILWVVFIVASLPAIIVQTSSLQTDIVVGALFVTSIALYLKENKYCLYFSSLSFAIATGVKSTGIMSALSILMILFGLEYFVNETKNLSKIKNFILFLILNFIIFSSYNYILNFIHFHNPFSNNAAYLGHRFWGGFKGFIANIIRFSIQFLDFTGFKWGYYLNDKILILENTIFKFLHINPQLGCNVALEQINIVTDEQTVGFGILGFLVYLPCIFYSLFGTLFNKNKKTKLLFIFGIAFILNIIILSISIGYMVYSIRFVVTFVLLSSVCLSLSYSLNKIIKGIIIFFMMFYMTLLVFNIGRMPFLNIIYNLKKNNYNIQQFEKDCFEGKVVKLYKFAYMAKNTISKKYNNCKKIGIFKTTKTPILYLKLLPEKKVDFLTASNADKYNLKDYDLIIMENKIQDDNVFNPEDITIGYSLDNEKVKFDKTNKIKCYYLALENDYQKSMERHCLGYDYMINNGAFKLDYSEKVKSNNYEGESEIYYFIKL